MSSLSELADAAQRLMADSGGSTWSQAAVEGWVNEAIRDYSVHFPRLAAAAISCTAGVRAYDLPAGFRGMVSVEHPSGQDPPQYLGRLPRHHPDFWLGEQWYDVARYGESGQADTLWISRTPAAGESIGILYQTGHDDGLGSGETVTVPDGHHNLLLAFVYWKGCQELLSAEQQSPTSSSSLLMGQLAANADRAKRGYFQAVAQALKGAEGESGLARWQGAETRPIY